MGALRRDAAKKGGVRRNPIVESAPVRALQVGLNAIGDPTRLAILRSLADNPLPVVDLARGFSVSRPAISQHLRVLKDAGLVNDQRQGTRRIYHIDPVGVEALKARFDALWQAVLLGSLLAD